MYDFHKRAEKNKKQLKNFDTDKRMPVWKMILTDVALTGISLCVFALYHHVLPRNITNEEIIVATVADSEESTFTLPGSGIEKIEQDLSTTNNSLSNLSKNTDEEKIKNYSNTNTTQIASDSLDSSNISSSEKIFTEVNSYSSDNIEFITDRVEFGTGNNKITYYCSDIYVSNVKYLRTAFASGEYGKNLRDRTAAMAEENNALLAISGDFYGNGELGVVIRNGVLYRSDENDADICVLFTDGTMKTYSPMKFNAEEVLEQGAWQAWTFGPELLDGEGHILASFNTTSYLNGVNPRCAIGYVEPGHYVFVVVDGRDPGYSIGVTLSELAQIMVDSGCMTAYNLDGGKSAAMVYDGSYVNQPSDGGRTISDIVYIGE